MGTPLPPNEPGDPCTVCFGPGKTFGDGDTPKFIKIRFSDFLPGQLWDPGLDSFLNTEHLIIQDAPPCTWFIIDTGFVWALSWNLPNASILIQRLAPLEPCFEVLNGPLCDLEYANQIVAPAGVITYDGKVTIDWDPTGLDE